MRALVNVTAVMVAVTSVASSAASPPGSFCQLQTQADERTEATLPQQAFDSFAAAATNISSEAATAALFDTLYGQCEEILQLTDGPTCDAFRQDELAKKAPRERVAAIKQLFLFRATEFQETTLGKYDMKEHAFRATLKGHLKPSSVLSRREAVFTTSRVASVTGAPSTNITVDVCVHDIEQAKRVEQQRAATATVGDDPWMTDFLIRPTGRLPLVTISLGSVLGTRRVKLPEFEVLGFRIVGQESEVIGEFMRCDCLKKPSTCLPHVDPPAPTDG